MDLFLQLLALGCATGGIYAISALGVVLVFRASNVINFSHGATAMLGGYVYWWLTADARLAAPLAIVAAVAVCALLGWLTYLAAIRPLSGASTLTKVIATLGVFVVVQQAVLLVFGTDLKVPAAFLPQGTVRVASGGMGQDQVLLLVFSFVMTAALWFVYRRTRFGIATTAVSESPRSLAALGWRVERVRGANWALGGAFAGVAGVCLAPIVQLQPGSFALIIIPTLASAMLGGLRSFPLTLLGGMALGVMQAELGHYVPVQGSSDAVPFLVIIGVLVFLGRSLPLRSHVNERLPRVGSGIVRPLRIAVGAVIVVVAVNVLRFDLVDGITVSLVTSVILLSQVVVTGYGGQLSLAQLPIAGVGALVAGRLAADLGIPFWLSLLVGGLAALPVGIAVGLPSLRARGVSLAIATIGFGVAINAVILRNAQFNGGVGGISVGEQSLLGIDLDPVLHPARYAMVAAAVLLLLSLAVANLRRGRVGRRLLAVRTNERAAASLGVDVAMTKLYAFLLGAFIAGVGGVLTAFKNPALTFSGYDVLSSISMLVANMIGGIGYIVGAVIGAVGQPGGLVAAVLNIAFFDLVKYLSVVLALGLIVQLVVQPNGIADGIARTPVKEPGVLGRALRRLVPASIGGRRRTVGQTVRAALDAELVAARADSGPRVPGGHLVLSGIGVRFGSVTAVDDVSLEVRPGEVVSVIGPNGAGKTTLMDAVSGFVGCTGSVTLDGRPLTGLSAYRRTRAGLVRSFQSLELLEDMTVVDNLRCASDPTDRLSYLIDLVHPRRGGLNGATASAIDTFELEDDLLRLPTELAYGTRHLVAVARAVAAGPRVLMLDEPAAGLSEKERGELATLIRRIADTWGIAILLVEHDVEIVRRVSDRVVALDFGAVIASGEPGDVLRHPAVVDAYLGRPVDLETVAVQEVS